MRIQYLLAIAGLSVVLAAPASAQSTVKKIGDETHHVLKTTGNAVKEGAKDAGTATHQALKTAGNDTKTEAGKVTGIHKVGGTVGKAAQGVSHTGKKIARSTRHSVKKNKAEAHEDLTKTGKDAKAEVKKPQ